MLIDTVNLRRENLDIMLKVAQDKLNTMCNTYNPSSSYLECTANWMEGHWHMSHVAGVKTNAPSQRMRDVCAGCSTIISTHCSVSWFAMPWEAPFHVFKNDTILHSQRLVGQPRPPSEAFYRHEQAIICFRPFPTHGSSFLAIEISTSLSNHARFMREFASAV